MPSNLVNALTSIADRLVSLATDDEQFRLHLRQLAQAVLDATETPRDQRPQVSDQDARRTGKPDAAIGTDRDEAAVPAAERRSDAASKCTLPLESASSPEAASPQHVEASGESPEPLPELTLGRSAPPAEPPTPSYPVRWAAAASDADVPLIEARCRLKAEGARWAAKRRRLLAEGAAYSTNIEPVDRDIIARAKAIPDCFLWMCHPSGPSPSDLRLYEQVAACFEAVADALAVVKQIQDESDLHQSFFERGLDLLAEAQSGLRVAIAEIDGPRDTDQTLVFNWLKATANEHQVFIQRFMRADDPADPNQWSDLSSRIEALDSSIQEARRQARYRRKLFGKVRHKLSVISTDPNVGVDHWRLLASAVDELIQDGVAPSNRELREMLVPVVDDLPDLPEMPKGFELVLREIDRYMATCAPPEATPVTQASPEVRQVARLLEDRSMVLIGGIRRPGSHQALKDAFRLRELIWIEPREHQSVEGFEPYVARPDVAVVVLAIRWSSHGFGEVRESCERHGKPLVRLPGGYNPNQVAAQIMVQCSERLRRD